MSSDVAANRRRLALCKAPLFPGIPSHYRYEPERCILIPKKKKPAKAHAHAQSQTQNALSAQTKRAFDRAELATLREVTGTWIQLPMKVPTDPELVGMVVTLLEAKDAAIIQLFPHMISRTLRTRYPDPVKRMAHLQRPDKLLGLELNLIVRYRVFRLMEAHLTEVMGSTL